MQRLLAQIQDAAVSENSVCSSFKYYQVLNEARWRRKKLMNLYPDLRTKSPYLMPGAWTGMNKANQWGTGMLVVMLVMAAVIAMLIMLINSWGAVLLSLAVVNLEPGWLDLRSCPLSKPEAFHCSFASYSPSPTAMSQLTSCSLREISRQG